MIRPELWGWSSIPLSTYAWGWDEVTETITKALTGITHFVLDASVYRTVHDAPIDLKTVHSSTASKVVLSPFVARVAMDETVSTFVYGTFTLKAVHSEAMAAQATMDGRAPAQIIHSPALNIRKVLTPENCAAKIHH